MTEIKPIKIDMDIKCHCMDYMSELYYRINQARNELIQNAFMMLGYTMDDIEKLAYENRLNFISDGFGSICIYKDLELLFEVREIHNVDLTTNKSDIRIEVVMPMKKEGEE